MPDATRCGWTSARYPDMHAALRSKRRIEWILG